MTTIFYTTAEWKRLSIEKKQSFQSVQRVTFRRAGRLVTEWKAVV